MARRRPPPVAGSPVVPNPAATVVLLRATPGGLEVLLTLRPSTMAFAAGMMVFPGGRVDDADADARLLARSTLGPAEALVRLGGGLDPMAALAVHFAAIRELFEEAGVLLAAGRRPTASELTAARSALLEATATLAGVAESLDVVLDPGALVPIARWVTPAAYARRFDVRMFAAELPGGTEPTFIGDEVAEHRWIRPAAALEAMAEGDIEMWIPTSSTIQRLTAIESFAAVHDLLRSGSAGPVRVTRVARDIHVVTGSTGGGIPGRSIDAFVMGIHDLTVVDPGDPSPEALAAIVAVAAEIHGRIVAIVLTSPDPEHSAGADELSERTGATVFAPPGAGRVLPFPVSELAADAVVPVGENRRPIATLVSEAALDPLRRSADLAGPGQEASTPRRPRASRQ